MTDGLVDSNAVNSSNQAPPTTEGLMTQDKANYLITKAKEHAYEQGMRAAKEEARGQGLTQEQILELIDKRAEEKVQSFHQNMAQRFEVSKLVDAHQAAIEEGRKDYSDFDEQVGVFDFSKNPRLVRILKDYPNRKDILYEMGQNPEKATSIYTFALTEQDGAARRILDKLSKSIEDNKAAQKEAKAKQEAKPLSQIKPSTASVGGGKLSYADIKSQMREIRKTRR